MTIKFFDIPNERIGRKPYPIFTTKIECTTDESGNCDIDSLLVNGEVLKIYYNKGTVTAATTATVTFEGETIDTYDVNTGSAHRYPRVETLLIPFVVSGLVNVKVTGGQAGKTFDVYVFSR